MKDVIKEFEPRIETLSQILSDDDKQVMYSFIRSIDRNIKGYKTKFDMLADYLNRLTKYAVRYSKYSKYSRMGK